MKTYDKIFWATDADIQERDKAIIELYDSLRECVTTIAQAQGSGNSDPRSSALDKYSDFVEKTRYLYGL